MRDPLWIDEAAAEIAREFRDSGGNASDWARMDEPERELGRAMVRTVLLIQDKHDCRGPADR